MVRGRDLKCYNQRLHGLDMPAWDLPLDVPYP